MQDRDKEFTPAPEHTVPEMAAPLPPEVMPPETPLPGESADSAAALKKRAASVIIPARASEPPMNTADERRLLVIEAP